MLGSCPIFPVNNAWNIRVDSLPVASNSASIINSIGLNAHAHPDFGTVWQGQPIGIPYNVVQRTTTRRKADSFWYAAESDNVAYPVPTTALVEAGSDAHCIMVDTDSCMLYELFAFSRTASGGFTAGSGAVWNLTSNALRPAGWTSADAAGLPIFPGLARYEEVAAGRITHALRFTAAKTRAAYQWPARHYAGSNKDSMLPLMGHRVRLKKSFNIASFPPQARVVLRGLQEFGMMLADIGTSWFIGGAPNSRWDDSDLHSITTLTGTQFEVVDMSSVVHPDETPPPPLPKPPPPSPPPRLPPSPPPSPPPSRKPSTPPPKLLPRSPPPPLPSMLPMSPPQRPTLRRSPPLLPPPTPSPPTPSPPTSSPSTPQPPPPLTHPPPPPQGSAGPTIGGCPIFPAGNAWNIRVDSLPVAANSDVLIASIGLTTSSHPDFGTVWNGAPIGIPFNLVSSSTPRAYASSWWYASESDNMGYPVPPSPLVEAGGDNHCIMIDTNACVLYELYAYQPSGSGFSAGSGAAWNLTSNNLRPAGWTSADAAGLPIFPGLARYDEVASGAINHALRFTASRTRNAYVWPARHFASSSSDPTLPPMGLRVRLKKTFDLSGFPPQAQVVLRALQQYGMMLADNGSPWFISGAPDMRWDDDDLHSITRVPGSQYEVVDMSSVTPA